MVENWRCDNTLYMFSFILFMFILLGVTSIEKIPKISASGRNFLDPLPPPSSKKGPTDKNVGILYLIVIKKFGFFQSLLFILVSLSDTHMIVLCFWSHGLSI